MLSTRTKIGWGFIVFVKGLVRFADAEAASAEEVWYVTKYKSGAWLPNISSDKFSKLNSSVPSLEESSQETISNTSLMSGPSLRLISKGAVW